MPSVTTPVDAKTVRFRPKEDEDDGAEVESSVSSVIAGPSGVVKSEADAVEDGHQHALHVFAHRRRHRRGRTLRRRPSDGEGRRASAKSTSSRSASSAARDCRLFRWMSAAAAAAASAASIGRCPHRRQQPRLRRFRRRFSSPFSARLRFLGRACCGGCLASHSASSSSSPFPLFSAARRLFHAPTHQLPQRRNTRPVRAAVSGRQPSPPAASSRAGARPQPLPLLIRSAAPPLSASTNRLVLASTDSKLGLQQLRREHALRFSRWSTTVRNDERDSVVAALAVVAHVHGQWRINVAGAAGTLRPA